MPSGRVHDRITYWCLPFVIAPTAMLTHSLVTTAIVGLSFLVGGLMLGPDLDIHSVQYTRWGPLRWIWLPYQRAIKHRSSLSHGPIIGTTLRVVYLSIWLAVFTLVSIELLNFLWDMQLSWSTLRHPFRALLKKYVVEWIAILIGLELGSISHSVSDAVGSHRVRKKRHRRNSRKTPRKKPSKKSDRKPRE